ncbi:MAG: hypothetical protein Kow00108_24530 [Calditrichia bacterium]
MQKPREVNIAIFIGWYAVIAISMYWILWFLAPDQVRIISPVDPYYPHYVEFEHTFILADTWIVIAALVGIIGLTKLKPFGFLFLNLAASSTIFLGLMDLAYSLQRGFFSQLNETSLVELFNVSSCLILGPAAIILLWKVKNHFFKN